MTDSMASSQETMLIKEIEAVIFDMDGIIFDSESGVIECWKEVADKHGIPDIEDMCRQCMGTNREESRRKFLDRYGVQFPYDIYKKEMSELFHSRYGGGKLPIKKGARELLCWLREKRIPTALASSTRREVVYQELTDAELISYFDVIICGDMVKRSKPEPDIFLMACEKLHATPGKSLVIEDSYNGIRAAYAGGMISVMIPDQMQPDEEMKEKSAYIRSNLFEVMKLLENNED